MRPATRLFAALLTVLALWITASATAATTYSDTIGGFEYYATPTEGMFAGSASGSLPGATGTPTFNTRRSVCPAA